jgi:exopolysaccharide production protein ExoY
MQHRGGFRRAEDIVTRGTFIAATKLVIAAASSHNSQIIAKRVPSSLRANVYEAATGHPLGGFPKRALDILVALMAVILLAPIILIVSALIRFFLGAPIVFGHARIGFNGKAFVCYKFRTMVVNADEVLEQHLLADPRAAREWRTSRKLLNDPRVTCLGKILRKSSLDELPQLFNILRGDMSLVGPRPIVADELEFYGQDVRHYLKTRPGLTGIWQTNGRSRLSYATRVACDRYYVRHWSMWLDVVALIKTLPAILNFDETA